MSRRYKHRGARIAGLFGFDDGQPTEQLDEVPDNPRTRHCTWCKAEIGEPCTTATRHGRIRKTGYHDARTSPQETP